MRNIRIVSFFFPLLLSVSSCADRDGACVEGASSLMPGNRPPTRPSSSWYSAEGDYASDTVVYVPTNIRGYHVETKEIRKVAFAAVQAAQNILLDRWSMGDSPTSRSEQFSVVECAKDAGVAAVKAAVITALEADPRTGIAAGIAAGIATVGYFPSAVGGVSPAAVSLESIVTRGIEDIATDASVGLEASIVAGVLAGMGTGCGSNLLSWNNVRVAAKKSLVGSVIAAHPLTEDREANIFNSVMASRTSTIVRCTHSRTPLGMPEVDEAINQGVNAGFVTLHNRAGNVRREIEYYDQHCIDRARAVARAVIEARSRSNGTSGSGQTWELVTQDTPHSS